jgi:putative oxidoreductase
MMLHLLGHPPRTRATFVQETNIMNAIPLANHAGRVLLGALFIIAGLMFFRHGDFEFARSVIADHGLPFPALLLIGTMVIQLVCGTMIVTGWQARWAAVVLLIWLVPATLLFHAPWSSPADQVANQIFHCLKNIAIAGGLLLVVGSAPRSRGPG